MVRHLSKQSFHGLLLVAVCILFVSLYCTPTRAATGSINGNVGSGSSAYYKVGGWTDYAYFKISFLSSFDLQLRLFDDDGNIVATGSATSSTTRQIYEYLSGGYTYYLVITYLSGTGAASFTLDYQDVYTISYYGNVSPFPLGDDPLRALAIGAPIILGVGFAIIGIFGRMKIRQRKNEIPLGAPAQLLTLAPATPLSPPAEQKPAPTSSPPAPVVATPGIKYCPYCGSDVAPGSTTCKGCGNTLH